MVREWISIFKKLFRQAQDFSSDFVIDDHNLGQRGCKIFEFHRKQTAYHSTKGQNFHITFCMVRIHYEAKIPHYWRRNLKNRLAAGPFLLSLHFLFRYLFRWIIILSIITFSNTFLTSPEKSITKLCFLYWKRCYPHWIVFKWASCGEIYVKLCLKMLSPARG